jgi:orotidine-5'-phosphate decarboxylase
MDVPDCDTAMALAEELGDAVTFYKLGLELMMSGGYFELLDWMLARDRKVFCDLKFFDIPATVGSAVRQLKDRGASFVTVHGNQSIMEAAADNKGDTLKVLGVTVLTSLDRGDLDDLGFDVVTPGIRPVDNKPAGDQKRVVTVETAFSNGADYIVVGRPIRDAASPRETAESIQASIEAQFA